MLQPLKGMRWHAGESRGATIVAFGKHITPLGRVLQVTWTGGGFTWHSPVAVEVRQGGVVKRLPIYNATRTVVRGIMLSGVAIVALTSWWHRRQNVRKRSKT